MQIDDAERKYKVLTDLTKKEIEYNQRMVRECWLLASTVWMLHLP